MQEVKKRTKSIPKVCRIVLGGMCLMLCAFVSEAQAGLRWIGDTTVYRLERNVVVHPPSLVQVFKTNTRQLRTPLAYCHEDLAFFCKIEVQLEQQARLPVKFRLGSVDYVDWLEGKRESY